MDVEHPILSLKHWFWKTRQISEEKENISNNKYYYEYKLEKVDDSYPSYFSIYMCQQIIISIGPTIKNKSFTISRCLKCPWIN